MTQLADNRELLSSIDWNRRSIQGFFGPSVSLTEGSAAGSDGPYADEREAVRTFQKHIENLLTSDPDDWLDYLRAANPILTEDHLDKIAMTTEMWLNDEARNQVRTLIRQRIDDCDDSFDILIDWLESESGIHKLVELLEDTTIPDLVLALCYAFCEALDISRAAYFIHRNRVHHDVDFSTIKRTPEEIAADIRFFDAS